MRHGSGTLMFARYAYPPNALGYCGPADSGASLARGLAGDGAAPDLDDAVERFDNGPYFRLIAEANGIADPLDPRVVEAYWVGNHLLERVTAPSLRTMLQRWPQGWSGTSWDRVVRFVEAGGVPHHSFHVLAAYPWLRLVQAGVPGRPLEVLDQCRIRWGTVQAVDGGSTVVVRGRHLAWDGHALALGPTVTERVAIAVTDAGAVPAIVPGDTVSLHWDRVCDRLTPQQVADLRRYTTRHLAIAAGAAPRDSGRCT
jgi:hypothetical protein